MGRLTDKKIKKWSLNGITSEFNGGEILRHIGTEVIYAKFTKNSENGGWDNELRQTTLDYVGDYDPMTGTYKVRHTIKGSEEKVETRIMSAGFEWGNPDEKGETSRLIPLSEHYRMMELTMYYERLRENYFKNQGVLGFEQIEAMSKGKNVDDGLKNILWIAGVIDTETENGIKQGILTFRVTDVSGLMRRSKSWYFNLRDDEGTLLPVLKFAEHDGIWMAKDFSYDGVVLGDLKIMDIESPREEVASE